MDSLPDDSDGDVFLEYEDAQREFVSYLNDEELKQYRSLM